MALLLDGTVRQSHHTLNPDDYSHENINFPVQGVVLNVYHSDDDNNRSAQLHDNQRGSRCEARVMIVNDGLDDPWVISNVVVLPHGQTGVYDYMEETPNPSTCMIDASYLNPGMTDVDVNKLDGDWCIVQFVGGDISHPIMTHWFPHPGNVKDPSTIGDADGTLIQGHRYVKRFAGVEVVISADGNVFVNTENGNSLSVPTEKGITRESRAGGGNVSVGMKSDATLEINFNPRTAQPDATPSLPQTNPPNGSFVRETSGTKVTFTEDMIEAIAGKVVQLIGKQVSDSILLGEDPTDHVILGEAFKAVYDAFAASFNAHVHIANGAPTGGPLTSTIPVPPNPMLPFPTTANPIAIPGPSSIVGPMPDSNLSEVVKTQ